MGRKSFSGWLRRCYQNVCLRSLQRKVAVGMAASAVTLAIVGIQEDHRDVDTAEQQAMTLVSPLSATGNTASMQTFGGWWGDRLVMSDVFTNQRVAQGLKLRLKP